MSSSPYLKQFKMLDQLLVRHSESWKPRPFCGHNAKLFDTVPQLKSALLSLSDEQLQNFTHDRSLLISWLKPYAPELATQLQAVISLEPPFHNTQPIHFNAFDATGIPGRKWQQITTFTQAIANKPACNAIDTVIDWCSGKGHFGMLLAKYSSHHVHCLEHDQALCEKGQTRSKNKALDLTFHCHDVLQPLPNHLTNDKTHHTALHACGDLHISMLQQCTTHGAHKISLAPCCYDKITHPNYQPLSYAAQSSLLSLNRDDLHLATEEVVTGGQRILRLRQQEQCWRLAFDALQRQLQLSSEYLPLPSIPKSVLSGHFSEFCQWAASLKRIPITSTVNHEALLKVGDQRRKAVERLELIRKAFQRPLELWLILDRVLFLQEQGYECDLSLFCTKTVSPRNFLIQARLPQT